MNRARRRGTRRRYVVSTRLLVLMILNALVLGFILGYGAAFLQWWNN